MRTQAAIDAGHPEWADLPATCNEAKAMAANKYFSGKPCKKGHVATRWTSGWNCTECQRDYEKSPKMREWLRAYQKKPRAVEYRRKYYRTYDKLPKVRNCQLERNQRRRATKVNATPPWLTPEHFAAMRESYAEAARLTETTGIRHHVDHIIPLNHPLVCGLHVPWNLQILAAGDNLRKNNSFDGTHENDGWRSGKEISN